MSDFEIWLTDLSPKLGRYYTALANFLFRLYLGKGANRWALDQLTPRARRQYMFTSVSVKRIMFFVVFPAMIQTALIGSYAFVDTALAANLAASHYPVMTRPDGPSWLPPDQVRTFISSVSGLSALLGALTVLFGFGLSTRLGAALGSKNYERAQKTLRAGMTTAMLVSCLMMPVVILSARPWIEEGYGLMSPAALARVKEEGSQYITFFVASYPLQMYWVVASGLFRVDARNRELLFTSFVSISANLFFDWVFMGPGNFGVVGSSYATIVANGLSALIVTYFLLRSRSDIIRLRNMFTWRLQSVYVLSVLFVGLAPFLRQVAPAVTQILESKNTQSTSVNIFHDAQRMGTVASGAVIIGSFLFTIILSFAQAARPIAAFNYGAYNYQRIKAIYYWLMFYTIIFSVFLYILFGLILGEVFLEVFLVNPDLRSSALGLLRIYLLSVPFYSLTIPALVLFGTTDRFLLAFLTSILRGIVFLLPLLYAFEAIAILDQGWEYWYWMFVPLSSIFTSGIVFFLARAALYKLRYPRETFDERMNAFLARHDKRPNQRDH